MGKKNKKRIPATFDMRKYGYKTTVTANGKPIAFAPKTDSEKAFFQQIDKAVQTVVAEAKAKHGEAFVPQIEIQILDGVGVKVNCKNF